MLRQLTLRGLDEDVALGIERVAREEGVSLDQSVQRLLRRGLERSLQEDDGVIGDSLSHLFGTWSAEEADEFDQAVADFDVIDEAMWG